MQDALSSKGPVHINDSLNTPTYDCEGNNSPITRPIKYGLVVVNGVPKDDLETAFLNDSYNTDKLISH